MDAELVEHIKEVPSAKPLNGSRVKNSKKISISVKMCVYFKDMECRVPVCDMKVCEKCPEGGVYCTRVSFIRSMVSKILSFLFILIFLSEII